MRNIHKNIKNNILALTFFDAHVSIHFESENTSMYDEVRNV